MNWCSFNADINGYTQSNYRTQDFSPVKLALIPEEYFDHLPEAVQLGPQTSMRHTRILLAAHCAIQEALAGNKAFTLSNIPLVQACPNLLPVDASFNKRLRKNLIALSGEKQTPDDNQGFYHTLNTGRSAVIEGIELAFKLFDTGKPKFVLVGGADSFDDPSAIKILDQMQRLNSESSNNGFCPGDGAAYILLTSEKEHALRKGNKCVALSRPSVGFEEGHLHSKLPYKGEGLAGCFRELLQSLASEAKINTLYSSMNGEQFWAKEYGVAFIRNQQYFDDKLVLQHPADCYGDLGAACGGALTILASQDLLHRQKNDSCLLYSSSDHGYQAATILKSESIDV